MDFKSIVVALILLAVLFAWYAWLEVRDRTSDKNGRRRCDDLYVDYRRDRGEDDA